MNSKVLPVVVLFLCSVLGGQAQKTLVPDRVIDDLRLTEPLSITFTDSLEIVSGSVFQYRIKGSAEKWSLSPADSTGTHNISWKRGRDGRMVYYAVGTNKNEILQFDRISNKPRVFTTKEVPELLRPHDIIYNPRDDYFYVINADGTSPKKYLLRFKELEKGYEKLDITSMIPHEGYVYARALTLHKNKLYIVLSSYGEVIRINDFKKGTYTYYGYQERKPAAAGSFSKTGLVLNDVEYYKGYWYGTNYFCSSYANGTNYNEYRFIRWKSWKDFENQKLEDVSDGLEKEETPYFLTRHDGKLYVVTFPDKATGQKIQLPEHGKVYVFRKQ